MSDDNSANHFAREIERYLDKLFRAAYRLTHDTNSAKDLVQETCLRAFAARDQWAATDSPLGWLMRVQYNLFINGTRRNRRQSVPLDGVEATSLEADGCFDPADGAEHRERLESVRHVWQQLSRDQQALLTLRTEGYTLAEMERITGLSKDVLNARLHRARKTLARLIDEANQTRANERLEISR